VPWTVEQRVSADVPAWLYLVLWLETKAPKAKELSVGKAISRGGLFVVPRQRKARTLLAAGWFLGRVQGGPYEKSRWGIGPGFASGKLEKNSIAILLCGRWQSGMGDWAGSGIEISKTALGRPVRTTELAVWAR
jgi:hypothetical protein